MISIKRATLERPQDRRWKRFLLTVGDRQWHISDREARTLLRQLQKLLEVTP